ncbi:MAG: ABC transporter ATP-binding protein [Negativicutes bacterium]
MNILEVRNLTKMYNDFIAVNEVNFSIEKGEIFGFLGPNGAGKTTTINMLTGLARSTSGSIMLAGVDCVKNIKSAQSMIGIVPDESNLYEEMDGFENLTFCAALYGMKKPEREKRAKELLEQFGLSNTGKKPFKAYSKGMKRKLTIAAGIIHNPLMLFLDEPSTGIDVESARQIRKLIRELNAHGTTIFLTTHQIYEAEMLCHRVGFIVDGKLVKIGTVEKLINESQMKNAIQFKVDNDISFLKEALEKQLAVDVDVIDSNTVRIYSAETVQLMPFIKIFTENNVAVYEAKIIKPSLEDVFVKVTGIGIEKMRKEKEGGTK